MSTTSPQHDCDLVMKGGVTSGVVYPRAILELARKYRFRSIGGASAGGIAAGFAAAAEYARRGGAEDAFGRLERRCADLPQRLESLFQANEPFKPLMAAALAMTGQGAGRGKAVAVAKRLVRPLSVGAWLGLALYVAIAGALALLGRHWTGAVFFLAGLAIAVAAATLWSTATWLLKLLSRDLVQADYGLCSGLRANGEDGPPALTEWLHAALQEIAFGDPGHPDVLTFGDLRRTPAPTVGQAEPTPIVLQMMTSNLSLGQPHVLPNMDLDLYFSEGEMRRLFPGAVVDHMVACGRRKLGRKPAPENGLLPLADGDALPVLVAVRMSLSFPFLFRAIPLHMQDIGGGSLGWYDGRTTPWKRVLFSDGGITSNFPIHFFDSPLPTRPTFAISLDDRSPEDPSPSRISLPQRASDGAMRPIKDIGGLVGFASAVFGAAKDWQDELQSRLPGQRQRVVRIALDKTEGGLNLSMSPEVSDRLMAYGQEAGSRIVADFDFAEHRYRRVLTTYPAVERLLGELSGGWADYHDAYRAYAQRPASYKTSVKPPAREEIGRRLDDLQAFSAARFQTPLTATVRFPRKEGRLRITPILEGPPPPAATPKP